MTFCVALAGEYRVCMRGLGEGHCWTTEHPVTHLFHLTCHRLLERDRDIGECFGVEAKDTEKGVRVQQHHYFMRPVVSVPPPNATGLTDV